MALVPVHLLLRHPHALPAPDRVLGVFGTREEADAGLDRYVSRIVSGEHPEEWVSRVYKATDPNELRKVLWVDSQWHVDLPDGATEVFVVSSLSEGFGESRSAIDGVCATWDSAEALMHQVSERQAKADTSYQCEITAAELGRLLPEETPES